MFPKGLIVSSQALEGNPLRNSEYLAVMAEAAVVGGAKAIRANGVDDIRAESMRTSHSLQQLSGQAPAMQRKRS